MINKESIKEKIDEYGYVDFKLAKEEEEWSVYCLDGKTIIKLKTIPLKFLKKDNDYLINSTVAMTVFSDPNLRGERSNVPLPLPTEAAKLDVLKKDEIDIKPDFSEEPWNEYLLDDGVKISIKTEALAISGTTLFDAEGEPVYLINHQTLIKKTPPIP